MARNQTPPQTQQEAQAQQRAAEKLKGDQYETINAYVDPLSYVSIKMKQQVVTYFGIRMTVDQSALPYQAREKSGQGSQQQKPRTDYTEAASQRPGSPKGKLIKIPVNSASPPKDQVTAIKGKLTNKNRPVVLVDRKYYYIRIPNVMNLSALVLMINTQFTLNKPAYFITAAGKRYYINTRYTDKQKLGKLGISTGEQAQKGPDDPNDTDKSVGQNT